MTTYTLTGLGPFNGGTVANGNILELTTGQTIIDFSVFGLVEVINNSIASNTTVEDGGKLLDTFGSLSEITTVNSGGTVVDEGVVTSTTISNGGTQIVSSFAGNQAFAGNTVIAGGTQIVHRGFLRSTTVSSGGSNLLSSGGTSSNSTVSSGGVEYVFASGTAVSATVSRGGFEIVSSGGISSQSTIFNGGAEYVYSDGLSISAAVNSGGFEVVSSGGTVSRLTVSSGGAEYIYLGGFTNGATISTGGSVVMSGGTLELANGAVVSAAALILGHGTIDTPQVGIMVIGSVDIPVYSSIANDGTIEAHQGTLVLDSDITGTGTAVIDQNATLELAGSFDSSDTVDFSGVGSHTLILDDAVGFSGSLANVAVGDQIVLQDTSNNNSNGVLAASIGSLDGTQDLQILQGPTYDPTGTATTTITLPIEGAMLDGTLTGDYFQVSQSNGGSATTLTLMEGNPIALSIGADTEETGAGITIGIISDSFNALGGENMDIAAGALPANIKVLGDYFGAGATDEGRAMAQIVHDIAPGAGIDFDTGVIGGSEGFADAIETLQGAGCNIIVDDLAFGPDLIPPGGTLDALGGTIDTTIDAAVDDGVTYITSADNYRKTGPTIYGHAADPDVLAVAAMNILATPSPVGGYVPGQGSYIPEQTEPFSSIGADASKPNITGPDGGPTTLPLDSGLTPFFGTSAAAPAVAAVAALIMQETPILKTEPLEVDQLLEESADPFADPSASELGLSDAQTEGAGLVDAGAAVALAAAICYRRGTHILTDRGEVAVEHLTIGDRLITRTGENRALRWVGQRHYNGRFIQGNTNILPVVIRAGAIAPDVPKRDLHISPRHAMYIDEVLIPAACLINGATIVQLNEVDEVKYFHLELCTHDVIVAEGALSESYLDLDNRACFHNATEYAVLYPNEQRRVPSNYAPRLERGAAVDAIWTQLAARAALLGYILPHAHTIVLDGPGVLRATVPAGVTELHVVSTCGQVANDQRYLGALVRNICLDGRPIALTDRRLVSGFHPVELHGETPVRWSNGRGVLAIGAAQHDRLIELTVATLSAARPFFLRSQNDRCAAQSRRGMNLPR